MSQLVFAASISLLHVINTAINDKFYIQTVKMRTKLNDDYFIEPNMLIDHAGTGIWIDLVVVVVACLGMAGYRKQKKGFIVSHLILNILSLILLIVLIPMLAETINSLDNCRRDGILYERDANNGRYNLTVNATTASSATFTFYGEEISGIYGTFYCHAAVFKVWYIVDVAVLVVSIGEFFITFTLLVYNSIAACSCCHKCDTLFQASPMRGDPPVAYYMQPVSSVTPTTTPMAPITHLQTTPSTQAIATPPYTQEAATEQQPAAGVSWQGAPPEYSVVVQSQPGLFSR